MPHTLAGRGTRGTPLGLGWGLLSLGLALGCDGQADPSYRGEPLVSVSGQVEAALSAGAAEVGILWLTASSDFDLVCTAGLSVESTPSACVAACGALPGPDGEVSCNGLASWEACVEACPDVTEFYVDVNIPSFVAGGVAQSTPAVGAFPAQFSLDILEPPPDGALIASATGERLAIGFFVALDPAGAPWRFDLSESPDYPDWLLGGSESHLLVYAPDGLPDTSIWSLATGVTLTTGYHLLELVSEQGEEEEGGGVREVPDGDASQVLLRIAPPDSIAWPAGLL